MAVKTITITIGAYGALKSLKGPRESFSDTILRVAKRKSLKEFVGILNNETGERLEKIIYETREKRRVAHRLRMVRIQKLLEK